jgi:superfamily I DNA/RNA helicase
LLRLVVTPDSFRFLERLGDSVTAAVRLGEAITSGEVPIVPNIFGAARLDPMVLATSPAGGTLEAGIAGLLAADGLTITWSGDEPAYEVWNVPAACSELMEVLGGASAASATEVAVNVRPDMETIAAAVIQAACGDGFSAARAQVSAGEPSSLPGVDALDAQQLAAVNAPVDAYVLINAAAGSGKTHTLAFRIAHLVSEAGLAAESCLALTFSVAARRQIRDRLLALASSGYPRLDKVEVRTLHSLALRLLVIAVGLGRTRFRPGFSIVDDQLVRNETGGGVRAPAPFVEDYDELFSGIDDGFSAFDRAALYPAAINALRNGHPELGLISRPDELSAGGTVTVLSARSGQFKDLSAANVRVVWDRYELGLARRNAIDLSGLVPEAVNALRAHPALLQIVTTAYGMAFVDEYQDTTLAQEELLFRLAEAGIRLNVVGDGDQTINSFAGARAENLLSFTDRVRTRLGAEAVTMPLETNYRSRPEIVHLATQIIGKNVRRLPKVMKAADKSASETGHVIRVTGELRYVGPWIALQVNALLEAGEDPSEIAVVYRKDAENSPQKAIVLEHLRSQAIAVSEDEEELGAVRTITIHRAKGLEFNHVFALYLGPRDFPDPRGDPEEERRLLYVAVTRARRTVYVCGRPGGDPDLYSETNVGLAKPTQVEVRSLTGVLRAADRDDLSRAYAETTIDDWDDPL